MTQADKIDFLKQKFLQCAYVKDAKKGYVSVSDFNLAIDPDVLDMASRCWAEHYHHDRDIDAIVGLPDAGARLVSILGSMLRITSILPSKRTSVIPGSWRDVVSYSNASFTTNQEEVKSHIGFVQPGMRVLVVDDVIAHGTTAVAALSALQNAGVEIVGLAVLFEKVWQKGSQRIFKETGVKAFSLIRIQELKESGEIVV